MTDFIPLAPAAPRRTEASPTFEQTLGASFKSESGFVSLFDQLTQREFPADPEFSLAETLSRRPELVPMQGYFTHAQSEIEVQDIQQRVIVEQKNRAIRQAAGLTGFMTDMVAGIFSPSTFVPFGAAVKGGSAAVKIGALAAAGATLDEAVLQAGQVTRTEAESVANVVGTALLGAALGTAVHMLTPKELEAAVKGIGDQQPLRMPPGGSINAAIVDDIVDPGLLRGTLSAEQRANAGIGAKLLDSAMRAGSKASTVMRNQVNEIPEVRALQAKISDAGLQFARQGMDNLTAIGGTVESRTAVQTGIYKGKAIDGLDEAYTKYLRGKPQVNGLDRVLAEAMGIVSKDGKYSRAQFNSQVFLELNKPQANQIPEVKAAADTVRAALYEPLGKEAVELELLPKGIDPKADGYVNHVYDKVSIERNPTGFMEMVIRSYQAKMAEAYATRLEKAKTFNAQSAQDISDLKLSDEETRELQGEIIQERTLFAESEAFDIRRDRLAIKAELKELKKLNDQGALRGPSTDPTRPVFPIPNRINELQERLKFLDSLVDEDMEATLKRDNALRRRSTLLSRSIGRLEARQAKAVEALENADVETIGVMRRSLSKTKAFLENMEGLSDEEYARGINELVEDFHAAVGKMEAAEAKAQKYREAHPELEDGPAVFERRIQRFRSQILGGGKLVLENKADRDAVIARLDAALAEGDQWTPAQLKSIKTLKQDIIDAKINSPEDIQAAFDKAWVLENQHYNAIGKTNTIANQLEDAQFQGPEFARAMLDEWYNDILTDVGDRVKEIGRRQDRLRARVGALDPELSRTRIAKIEGDMRKREEDLTDWLGRRGGELGDDGMPNFAQRGREFAQQLKEKILGDPVRVVGMDLGAERGAELTRVLDIPIEEKMEFLETDMDKLVRIYASQVIPDLELTRAGLGVNGAKAMKQVRDSFEKRIADTKQIEDPVAREKEAVRLQRAMEDTLKSFTGQIQRLRHQRGHSPNPEGYLYRGGRLLQDWNVATMMGNVIVPSLLDPAIAVGRYGMRRVWRHALAPFITQLKDLKIAQREAQYMGINELLDQNRLYQLSELVEDTGRRTRGEKAASFLASKIGIAGLFSFWTQRMKEFVTPVVAGKLLDAVETYNVGTSKYMKADEARKVLAHMHIDDDLARRIWAQYANGGLQRKGDLWIPNTESWDDVGAVSAFRSAVMSEINSTIITPGVENPLFLDANMGQKLLFQFQSFMWSSNTKVLMAGLQRHDWAAVEGILASVGLGAMAYAADSIARGRWEEARNEGYDVWADEILARSPFLGVLSQGLKYGQATPLKPYLTFSDKGAERIYADSLRGVMLGPSYTTLGRVSKVASEIADPTQSTANTVKQLTPYNNVIWARWMFDKIVENSGLPETRQ